MAPSTATARRRTQAERSRATTGELVAAARKLFAERGFAETSIEDIVQATGVTRGALYHHFASKTDVFKAVFEQIQRELDSHSYEVALATRGDAWKRMEAGSLAFLDDCQDPGVRQIFLIDGFAALGWDSMREIEHRHSLQHIKEGIGLAMQEGILKRRPVGPLATMLFGAMCEAAMAIARADDPDAAAREMRRELKRVFAALRER
jgi:AcrR family transcriptional regulator